VYSQSELLQKEVFLVEMIDSISVSKESMSHLKAVYFIRPTSDNIQKLRYQLANPRFGEYHLFFSNLLKDTQIHILADSDEQEVVQQVQVIFRLPSSMMFLNRRLMLKECFIAYMMDQYMYRFLAVSEKLLGL
jgi:hypothetical protein